MLEHPQFEIKLRKMIYKKILQGIAHFHISVVQLHEKLVWDMLSGHPTVQPPFIRLPDPARQPERKAVSFHKVHKVSLNKENLLLGKLRLHKRHSSL